MLIDAAGTITIRSAGAVAVTAPQITLNGDVRINGILDLGGIILNTHKHTDVEPGPSLTGGPTN
ncbi:MAG: hypothetical protein JO293_05620 [Candidatus Eremiobacteraeota bacterium]|nr:hypothetical protein [Candidatus Eremiobacteraeota bacterium]